MVGQVKSVKTVLKQLQQSIQTVTSAGWPSDDEMVPTNIADNFQWLTKDHLCILVYLVTVMHSMQVSLFPFNHQKRHVKTMFSRLDTWTKHKSTPTKPLLRSKNYETATIRNPSSSHHSKYCSWNTLFSAALSPATKAEPSKSLVTFVAFCNQTRFCFKDIGRSSIPCLVSTQ